jgi:tRNA(Ile2) C34 agmatinyltransferase TiaS
MTIIATHRARARHGFVVVDVPQAITTAPHVPYRVRSSSLLLN